MMMMMMMMEGKTLREKPSSNKTTIKGQMRDKDHIAMRNNKATAGLTFLKSQYLHVF